MQFNPGSGAGIIDEIDFLANSDTNTYPLVDKTRNVNRWLDTVVSDILMSSGTWQWDDTNFATTPRATTDLVSGQKQYTFDATWLSVERIDIKDSSGNWLKLIPLDQSNLPNAYAEFRETDGTPEYFDIEGDSLYLFPAPNYASDEGLKVWFRREPDYFTTSGTTQEPGFAAPFHRILSLGAAHDYALANELSKANILWQELEKLRQGLKEHYGSRIKYERPQIRPARRNGDYQ